MCGVWVRAADETEHHYLYMTTPDGAQGGGSGSGILVFDIDHDHAFVRRIDVPSFKEGVRGICAAAATHRLYATVSNKRIVCVDLLTDKVDWEKTYDTGADRLAITPDGTRLYVPCGYWEKEHKSWAVIDAANGKEIAQIQAPSPGHNTLLSLDGERAYLASNSWLSIVDTKTNTVLHDVETGSKNFFPLTVNSDRSRVYVCLGKEVGFQIIDANAGTILQTVYPDGDRIKLRTHGVGLTPDEKEIWISEQNGRDIFVFDNTQNPPRQSGRLAVSLSNHGWITFSLDGRFAYTSSVEVVDAKTKKVVAMLKDDTGKPFCGSKNVEIVFKGKDVTAVGDQFGVGRAHSAVSVR